MSTFSSLTQRSLSSPYSPEQAPVMFFSDQEQQGRIKGLPLAIWEKILTTYLSPKDFQAVSGVNHQLQDLSKSLKRKFPIVIGKIILSYLGAEEVPSIEGEITLNDSIQWIKKRDISEINIRIKKFSELIYQQLELELKDKEILENYKEQLKSVKKIVHSDVTLKVLKILDLKKQIEFFLLLKDL